MNIDAEGSSRGAGHGNQKGGDHENNADHFVFGGDKKKIVA
jgi:hypothetical protein